MRESASRAPLAIERCGAPISGSRGFTRTTVAPARRPSRSECQRIVGMAVPAPSSRTRSLWSPCSDTQSSKFWTAQLDALERVLRERQTRRKP